RCRDGTGDGGEGAHGGRRPCDGSLSARPRQLLRGARSPAATLPGAEHARADSPRPSRRLRAALQSARGWLEPDGRRVGRAGGSEVQMTDADAAALAAHALTYVSSGQVIGLGSGQAATAFVRALGRNVQAGLRVTGVPTSEATAALAKEVGIPLATLEDVPSIDVTVDGADEVDARLDLIKGYGGALVREKIVAAASRRLVILVGREKLVPVLGSRGKLPVEVVPFAAGF